MVSLSNRTYVEDPEISDPTTAFIYYDTSTYETFLLDFSKELATPLKTAAEKPKDSVVNTA